MPADRVELPDGQEFFKLNEVCKLANVQPYMLRFWGTEFDQLEASTSDTGQRLYSRVQVELILEIRRLLFDEGLTIAGTRKRLEAADQPEETAKAAKKPARAAKTRKRTATAADAGGAEAETAPAEAVEPGADQQPAKPLASREEVDKIASERVQPLLATLKELRDQVAAILAELRAE